LILYWVSAKVYRKAEDPLGFRFISDKIGLALDLLKIRLVLEPHIMEV
jgi:hypothetical protein